MADDTPQPDTPAETPDQPVAKHGGKPTMAVKVYAPFQVYFEGEAYSISAINATGPFDVLPHHHNFLSMLVPCTLTIQTPDSTKTIPVSRALMHVKADRVVVFVGV